MHLNIFRWTMYHPDMASKADQREKLDADAAPVEPGYDAWKQAKVEHGLAQSRDRSAMIPVEQVLRDLTLAR